MTDTFALYCTCKQVMLHQCGEKKLFIFHMIYHKKLRDATLSSACIVSLC